MKSTITIILGFIFYSVSITAQNSVASFLENNHWQGNIGIENNQHEINKYQLASPQKQPNIFSKRESTKYSLDSLLYGIYYQDGTFSLTFKDEFVYDASGNVISKTKYRRSSSWVFKNKSEYTYAQDENKTTLTYYGWDDDKDEWKLGYRYYYYFDDQNNLSQFIDSNYLDVQDTWEIREKLENTYDENGRILTTLEKNYFFGELDSQEKIEYDYNTDNKLQLETRYETDDDDPTVLLIYWKVEYNYDNDGNLTPKLSYGWDVEENIWSPKWKLLFTYNNIGKAISEIAGSWISADEFWKNQWKYEYAYDGNTNPISRLQYRWNSGLEEWYYAYKKEFAYDLAIDYSDLVLPPFEVFEQDYVGDIESMPLSYEYYIFEEGVWKPGTKNTYHYSEILLSAEELETPKFEIFPNPASDQLTISNVNGLEVEEINIYNLSGQRLIQRNGKINTIDVSNLENGLYTIELRFDESTVRKKVIIAK